MNENEDLRIIRTRKLLSNAMLELLEKESIDEISIKEICDKAMVHRTTFYKHFNDKYDLFNYVFVEMNNELSEKARNNIEIESSKQMYSVMVQTIFDFLSEKGNQLKNIMIHNDNSILKTMFCQSLEKSIERFANEYQSVNNVPSRIISTFYIGAIISLAVFWIHNPHKYTKEQMIAYTNKLIDEEFCK